MNPRHLLLAVIALAPTLALAAPGKRPDLSGAPAHRVAARVHSVNLSPRAAPPRTAPSTARAAAPTPPAAAVQMVYDDASCGCF